MENNNFEPKPYTNEMHQYLFVNVLRFLTDEQKENICFDIFTRLSNKEKVKNRINNENIRS